MTVRLLLAIILLAGQQQYPGPNPADGIVVRPGKVIKAPNEVEPPATTNPNDPPPVKPGGGNGGGNTGPVTPPGLPANFGGDWETTFRHMKLVQQGAHVSGSYDYKGGMIDGTVSGGVLRFRWVQTNEKGAGRFLIAPDGQSFAGAWTYSDDPDRGDKGAWNGKRGTAVAGGVSSATPRTGPAGNRSDPPTAHTGPTVSSRPGTPADPPLKPPTAGGATAGGAVGGLTLGAGLKVARWYAFHRITHLRAGELNDVEQLRISADGSKIAVAAYSGTYTINADGSGLVRLSDKVNNNPGIVDLSADGRTVVWADTAGLFVAASDGSRGIKLPVNNHVISARMTADARRVFVLCNEIGILTVETGGPGLVLAQVRPPRTIMTTAAVCRLIGTAENGNHWRGWPSGLDISNDGSHVVFRLLSDAFAMNGDGSDLRRVTAGDAMDALARISGDGRRVAVYSQEKGIRVQDWQGGSVVMHSGEFTRGGNWMQLTGHGETVLLSWGLRLFNGNNSGRVDLSDWGSVGDHPLNRAHCAAIAESGRRVGMIVEDQGAQQIEVGDLLPDTMQGLPAIADIRITPGSIPSDGSAQATAAARVSGSQLATVGVTGLRDGFGFREWSADAMGLKGGDTYSTPRLRLVRYGPPLARGPITLRFFAWDKQKNALVLDVDGFESR